MLIGELSKRAGVTAHTIRFYEKSGLIRGKRDERVKSNKYKHYDEETVEKLMLIRDAKSVGFTLAEIGQLIDAWYSRRMPVAHKLTVLNEKLVSLDERIRQLKAMKKMISQYKQDVADGHC